MVRAVSAVLLSLVAATLGGCAAEHREPIAFAPHGAAVRANMAAQIIDPTPSMAPPGPMDAGRAIAALERYRTDDIEALGNVSTAPTVVVAPPN